MKTEIIANLKELHHNFGIMFTSEKDEIEYYRSLVELIEALIEKGIHLKSND